MRDDLKQATQDAIGIARETLRSAQEVLGGDVPREPEKQLMKLQAKVEMLERYHEKWVSDLLEQLNAIPDPGEAWISSAKQPFTVAQLIDDIRKLTPRGIEHTDLWRNALKTLHNLGKKI
jgi:hypothetical protein